MDDVLIRQLQEADIFTKATASDIKARNKTKKELATQAVADVFRKMGLPVSKVLVLNAGHLQKFADLLTPLHPALTGLKVESFTSRGFTDNKYIKDKLFITRAGDTCVLTTPQLRIVVGDIDLETSWRDDDGVHLEVNVGPITAGRKETSRNIELQAAIAEDGSFVLTRNEGLRTFLNAVAKISGTAHKANLTSEELEQFLIISSGANICRVCRSSIKRGEKAIALPSGGYSWISLCKACASTLAAQL